jgi:hypothetical protein
MGGVGISWVILVADVFWNWSVLEYSVGVWSGGCLASLVEHVKIMM